MDFYAHQDRARAASRRLTALFALSLAAVVGAVNGAAALGWLLIAGGLPRPQYFFATNSLVTLLVVFGGAWIELHRLREGGAVLAERLGARPIDVAQPLHRRLRDVAEEVAIGAGAPVPSLHVLDEDPINALAAGERPGIAAVMVTRGALERLPRAELQGVVAHEIAHVVGGDTELNMRLTAALYGLYSLRLAGYRMLGFAVSREQGPLARFGAPRAVAFVAGALLSGVGMLGVLAAQVLKAGISRQREFLADAVAVQITRDRDGLGCALRRIAGEAPAPLRSDYAALVSHFLMVQPAGLKDWFDTHPPLSARVARLYGRRMPPIRPEAAAGAQAAGTALDAVSDAAPDEAPDATPGAACAGAAGGAVALHGQAASGDTIPFVRVALPLEAVAATDPGGADTAPGTVPRPDGAQAASMLIARIRSASLGVDMAGRWLVAMVAGRAADEPDPVLRAALDWLVSPAGAALRVPLLELLLARVRPWGSSRRRELLDRCRRAVEADGRVHSGEWIYYTLARHRLSPGLASVAPRRRAPSTKQAQSRALAALFAMAAAVGEASARVTRDTLADAAAMLDVPPPASTPDEVGTTELALALDTLLGLPPLDKPILLKALFALARTPGDPNVDAFVRAVAAAIDCPVPHGAGQQLDDRRDAASTVA